MPELVSPTTSVHRSFLVAMDEFRAEGRGTPSDHTSIGREISEYGASWSDPDQFAEFVERLRAEGSEQSPRAEGRVPQTTLWYVREAEYLGRIGIRHRLTPFLLHEGGHVGYDVRPSARRCGHATRMLRLALPVANGLGIDPVLVTCDFDNVASKKVIEAGGGKLEDRRNSKLRYWVPTSARDATAPPT